MLGNSGSKSQLPKAWSSPGQIQVCVSWEEQVGKEFRIKNLNLLGDRIYQSGKTIAFPKGPAYSRAAICIYKSKSVR